MRKILKHLKRKLIFLNLKDNQVIFFNSQRFYSFKNFIHFQYYAIKVLTHLNFFLNLKNETVFLAKFRLNFKPQIKKIMYTKLKYWLDDFFSGNKDEYVQDSMILATRSKILRYENSNFF